MIAGLAPYGEMKDSAISWLGIVPKHWSVLPHRALFSEVKSRDHVDEKMLSVTIKRGVIEQRDLLSDSSKKDGSRQDKSAYKLVCPGDVAYNKMRAWQGALGVSSLRGIVSPAYVVMRPIGHVVSRYFHYLLRTPAFAKEAERWSYGITSDMWSLRPEHFKLIYCCVPPTDEQAAIVRFLDHADRRIRRAIAAKQKLIRLLGEQKQVVIHRAVTRGLDPDVRLKPSGVEWLGDVPEHWDVLTLGRGLTSIAQGWSPLASEEQIAPDQWAVLTLSSVKRGCFNPNATKPIPESANIPDGIEIREGDLLLTRSNTRELVGDVCIVAGARPKTVMCDLIYRLTPNARRFNSTFLMYQLLSRVGRRQIEQDARGSSGTMPKISQRHIRAWRVLSPPLDEQCRISAFVASELECVNAATDRIQREIAFLHEYSTRLIADVVTGKLDVREATTRLPESSEPELPDDEALDAEGDGEASLDEAIAEDDAA